MVGCASLPALCLAVTPGKRPIKPPLKRCNGGQSGDACLFLSVPLRVSLGEEEQKVLQCCAILEDSWDCRGRFPLRLLRPCLSMELLILILIWIWYSQSNCTPLRGILFWLGSRGDGQEAPDPDVLQCKCKCFASCAIGPLGVQMCVQALARAGAFQAAPSNLIGPEARYQITLGKGRSAAASIFCLGERGTKGTE